MISLVPALSQLLWSEPNVSRPPAPTKREVLLVAGLIALSMIEFAIRPDLTWRNPSWMLYVVLLLTLLGRRQRPLLMSVIVCTSTTPLQFALLLLDVPPVIMYTPVVLLLLPYSLFRWDSGRRALTGLTLFLGCGLFDSATHDAPLSEWIGGIAVVLLAAALGTAQRYRAHAHFTELAQVKLRERELLARELHDSVAHHVSAIVIRAQAGLAMAAKEQAAASDALRVIEAEASRCLAEMRTMVRSLRQDEPAALTPHARLVDLEQLNAHSGAGPEVVVSLPEAPPELSPTLSSALYRLAQESVTNVRRHARNARRVEVSVRTDASSVHLCVSDDGEAGGAMSTRPGYGIVGMRERAELLGGTCQAGPNPSGGWTVTAVLPRNGRTP
jgi:signal transduction histidine kinase